MKPRVDWSLYLVVVPQLCLGRPPEDVVRRAVAGGVTVVQLRDKECSTRRYVECAGRLHDMLAPRGVPLIINDRLDVAMAVGAEGVHLGQSDMPPGIARRLMGPHAIIGLSIDEEEQALGAETAAADYLGIGPIFPTSTKADTSPEWGPAGLRALRARCGHVLVGIGGVNAANAADVIRAGADGIAVVSAICSAEDPERAAAELRHAIDAARDE